MTKREIADFFGWKAVVDINKAFVAAEPYCDSIRIKKGHYNKKISVDYTLEETLIALEHISDKVALTPIMIRLLKENFIHREQPFCEKTKELKWPYQAKQFLYLKRVKKIDVKCCSTCTFLEPRCPNREFQRPQPYCKVHEHFINKSKPRIDIYLECCGFYKKEYVRHPVIFTEIGPVDIYYINYKNQIRPNSSKMLGIPQNNFKSKRKRNEPVIILKDAFDY